MVNGINVFLDSAVRIAIEVIAPVAVHAIVCAPRLKGGAGHLACRDNGRMHGNFHPFEALFEWLKRRHYVPIALTAAHAIVRLRIGGRGHRGLRSCQH